MITPTRITFYAFLLLVVSCAVGLAGEETKVNPPASAAPDEKSKTVAPSDFMGKMLRLLDLSKVEHATPALVANALCLIDSGDWLNFETVAKDNIAGLTYAFAISRGTDQDVLLTCRGSNSILSFRARRDGTLVTATSFDLTKRELNRRTNAEAQADFNTNLIFWKENVDLLISQNTNKTSTQK